MKKFILLLIVISCALIVKSQQLPQITQYMENNYAVNPAIAGMDDYYQLKTTVRNMWMGVDGAPRTTILSIYGRQDENIGIGGMVYSDQAGATSRIGGNISYSHHFSLSDDIKISLALSGGFLQYKLIKSQLEIQNPNDPLLSGPDVVKAVPDATFGMNTYAKNWYVGFAIPQLIGNNIDFVNPNDTTDTEGEGKLVRHYYVLGAYKHILNPFWSIEPSVLLKNMSISTEFDIGVKATWDDKLWFGAGYRNNGDISALAGYAIQERYMIGYSYDMPNSELGASHEFVLGIRFLPLNQEEIIEK